MLVFLLEQYCAEHGIKANSYKNTVRKILKDEEIGNVMIVQNQ